MATIYLMIDEKRDIALAKVGYASNIQTRLYAYTSHNPLCNCVDTMRTQDRSRRNIEKAFQNEISTRGYGFVKARIDGKRTEWFAIDYNDPFYGELKAKGLRAFKEGKNRKSCGGIKVEG